ncbi:MAG: hypothetical protein FWG67_03820 [Defluviitaleaceae bacterium]|nr:hypothetical protein [Defluviitaleaceae bacterium]
MEKISLDEVRTGDFIVVASHQASLFSTAIADSGVSRAVTYDHIGLVERKGELIFIWHAHVEQGVCCEKWADFIKREARQAKRIYHVYRLSVSVDVDRALLWIREKAGLPYNHSFIQSDDAYYCSDLIGRAFSDAVFSPINMNFVGAYWETHYKRLGIEIPMGQVGYHPTNMVCQDNMTLIGAL